MLSLVIKRRKSTTHPTVQPFASDVPGSLPWILMTHTIDPFGVLGATQNSG
jgi:hypothetical protein